MKPFTTVLLASAFALTATLAVAQSDPHHPAAEADVTEEAAPETPAPEPQKAGADAACPDSPSMMMDMMTMMGSGDAAMMPMMQMQMMQMMQMMQGTQLEMMRTMTMMQEQMALMQQRLEDRAQPEEKSP